MILPSISLLPSNCGMAEELWAMIKFLPYERRYLSFISIISHFPKMSCMSTGKTVAIPVPISILSSSTHMHTRTCTHAHARTHIHTHRYQLYGHWKNDSYNAHPVLIEAKTETLNRGKYIMK